MKLVGKQLAEWAEREADFSRKDLFGRSAINRYYYASFLITRQMLGEFDESWKQTAHAGIPGLLETRLRRQVSHQLKQSERNNLVSHGEASALKQSFTTATAELANLLREAYQARIVADYEPEQVITLSDENIIQLDRCKISTADHWPDRASSYCKQIRKVWRAVGLV